MKAYKTIKILIMLMIIASLIIGCSKIQEKNPTTPSEEKDISPPKSQTKEVSGELIEKRGQQTNITDFKELLKRLSKIQSFKYTYKDTNKEGEWRYFILGRFVKVKLNELKTDEEGEKYSEVFMDRITKQAFAHCGREYCDKDKEVERVDYNKYYQEDPYELASGMTNAQYLTEDMIGQDVTKVFKVNFYGKPAKVWMQEYYGYPIKIDLGNRVIEYKNMTVDATRTGEIDMPFNFTIKGEPGRWYFWDHYLGLWPNKKKSSLIGKTETGA